MYVKYTYDRKRLMLLRVAKAMELLHTVSSATCCFYPNQTIFQPEQSSPQTAAALDTFP